MPFVKTTDGTGLFYKDWGEGQPIVFSHGWPLSSDAWEDQMFFLASHGTSDLLDFCKSSVGQRIALAR